MTDTDAQNGDTTERHDPPRRWPWLAGAMLLLALGGAAYWLLTRPAPAPDRQAPAPPLVETVVARATGEIVITQTAFVRPRAQVPVTSQIQGRIEAVGDDFRLGGRIAKGGLLIALETGSLRADMQQAQAGVKQAQAALQAARIARARQEELEEENIASEARLEDAIVAEARARADLASAEARLTQAQDALDDAEVRAPFDAIVTAESAARGALVQPGAALGTLVDAGAAELEMGLAPADLDILGTAESAVGRTVHLRGTGPDAMALGTGTVAGVDPRIVQGTRTVALIVVIREPFAGDPDGNRARPLRIDELVEASLSVGIGDRAVVQVPADAVKGRNRVWVVEDGRLKRLEPAVLRRGQDRVLLDGDVLPAGSRVMVSDLAAALEGQSVRVAKPAQEETGSKPAGD